MSQYQFFIFLLTYQRAGIILNSVIEKITRRNK
jgi:hypothetical protein